MPLTTIRLRGGVENLVESHILHDVGGHPDEVARFSGVEKTMSDPRLEASCGLLRSYGRVFGQLATEDLYSVVMVTTDRTLWRSSPAGGRDETGERFRPPFPLRLWSKEGLDWWSCIYASEKVIYEKSLYYFGSRNGLNRYREVADPAARALISVMSGLKHSRVSGRLEETASDFDMGDWHLRQMGGGDYATLWSLAVHDVIDAEDQGTGMQMERLFRPDASRNAPKTPWDLYEAPRAYEIAAQRHGTLVFAPITNLFLSSSLAIKRIVQIFISQDSCVGASLILGINLNRDIRRITREGHTAVVEFKGKDIAWAIFCEMCKKGLNYTSNDEMKQIWKQYGITADPEPTTIQAEMSQLRKILEPLSLGVENSRRLGYRLTELNSGV